MLPSATSSEARVLASDSSIPTRKCFNGNGALETVRMPCITTEDFGQFNEWTVCNGSDAARPRPNECVERCKDSLPMTRLQIPETITLAPRAFNPRLKDGLREIPTREGTHATRFDVRSILLGSLFASSGSEVYDETTAGKWPTVMENAWTIVETRPRAVPCDMNRDVRKDRSPVL